MGEILQIQQIHNRMEEKLNELPPQQRQQYQEQAAENTRLVASLERMEVSGG